MLRSYPSIYNLGHKAIVDLLKYPVVVQEKVDGSQFSFGKNHDNDELFCRSKGAPINMLAPEKMFTQAVETVNSLANHLVPGWTYRGEYLKSPHHNALTYSRVPKKHIILFDIETSESNFLDYSNVQVEARRLDLEVVPVLFEGLIEDVNQFRALLDTESILGGQKIEGVAIKQLDIKLFSPDKKALMGKFVSEAFREIHSKTWDTEHKTPGQSDIIDRLGKKYGTNARWQKALIHLRERGVIDGTPKDIGLIIAETPCDVLKECREQILVDLFEWAWPQLRRRLTSGLPEWYKEELLKQQFSNEPAK